MLLAMLLDAISGIEGKYLPFHTPVDQYGMEEFNGLSKNWSAPLGSNSLQYAPVAGSIKLFQETRRRFRPVTLSHPSFAPGKSVSVGWSKLCHKTSDEFEESLRMRFPLLKSIAMVLFVVVFSCVDQTTDLVHWFKMTRLPSWEIVSSREVVFLIGLSLFATHAEVNLGTVLNHMPRYQFVVSWEDLLLFVLKKPSAYLPSLEMSLSLAASAWPGKMVSVTAELAGMCRKKSKVIQLGGQA